MPSPKATPPRLRTTSSSRRPVAVAVTGGIGAGKSETLRAFERHGAAVISSDEIVHRLLREDAEVKSAIIERFGEGVLGGDGEIDRGKVGKIVFGDRSELDWLEALLHPRVVTAYMRWREELAGSEDPPAVCATEVPLLYENRLESALSPVIVVSVAPEVQVARVVARDSSTEEEARARARAAW